MPEGDARSNPCAAVVGHRIRLPWPAQTPGPPAAWLRIGLPIADKHTTGAGTAGVVGQARVSSTQRPARHSPETVLGRGNDLVVWPCWRIPVQPQRERYLSTALLLKIVFLGRAVADRRCRRISVPSLGWGSRHSLFPASGGGVCCRPESDPHRGQLEVERLIDRRWPSRHVASRYGLSVQQCVTWRSRPIPFRMASITTVGQTNTGQTITDHPPSAKCRRKEIFNSSQALPSPHPLAARNASRG